MYVDVGGNGTEDMKMQFIGIGVSTLTEADFLFAA